MNPELMVAIFWIAQKPEWEVWITTGIEGSPTGRRGPDVLPSVALECVTIERLTASRANSAGIPRPADLSWITMQNGYAERLIGTLRRECLDQMVIFSEPHLRRILSAYATYYNQARTHLALQKDAPLHRAVQRSGAIVAISILDGLHHQYVRI
jgi:transposase InsO family protein